MSLLEVLVAAGVLALAGAMGAYALILASRRLPEIQQRLLFLQEQAQLHVRLQADLNQTPAVGVSLFDDQLALTPVQGANPLDQGAQWEITQVVLYRVRQGVLERGVWNGLEPGDRPCQWRPAELQAWLSSHPAGPNHRLFAVDEWQVRERPLHHPGFRLRLRQRNLLVEQDYEPNLGLAR